MLVVDSTARGGAQAKQCKQMPSTSKLKPGVTIARRGVMTCGCRYQPSFPGCYCPLSAGMRGWTLLTKTGMSRAYLTRRQETGDRKQMLRSVMLVGAYALEYGGKLYFTPSRALTSLRRSRAVKLVLGPEQSSDYNTGRQKSAHE